MISAIEKKENVYFSIIEEYLKKEEY